MTKFVFPVIFIALMSFLDSACAVTRAEVIAGAELLYRSRITEYESANQLDTDPVFLARVRHIADRLITQAKKDFPVAEQYAWEVHVTDAQDESASCMAGGKLLVGRPYVTDLELNEAELAMLLSHEIQHAVLEHNFREFQEALRIEPDRRTSSFADLEQAIDHDDSLMDKLADFNRAQEGQADLEGLRMAWRAGWPAAGLAGYYKKLVRAGRNTNGESRDHPSSMLRWQAVQQLTLELSNSEHHD